LIADAAAMAKLVKIEGLLKRSAGRFFSDAQLEPDPALIAEGWERRFTADENRAKEAEELYKQLGYEVRAEPVRAEELDDDCQDCRTVVSIHFRTIYTRKKKE
jgi:hypothetical protein